jgi:Carboxypeptidase regulatory-like domain
MTRRVIRTTGLAVVALFSLGLTACDTGPVLLEGTLSHAETGAALDGIPVRVYSSTEENVLVARTRTGEDGSYRLRTGSLAEGTYRVLFSTGHWWQDGDSWSTAHDVVVSAGQPARLDAALVPTMTTVFGETLCCGGASSGVRVDAFHADTGELFATTHSVEIDGSTGYYELELPAGDIYTFRVSFTGWTTTWYPDVELPPGEHRMDFRQLDLYSAFRGRVVDTSGTPIAGARVVAISPGAPGLPQPEEVTTRADGTFFLPELTSGDYWLLVIAPDGTPTLVGMVGGDPATATVFFVDFAFFRDVGDITLGGP